MPSPLTDTKCRNAKPLEKAYKLQDGQGLYLEVRTTGVKVWRYRYWLTPQKDGIYTIGEYPGVTLSDARRERERVRELVKTGQNPTQVRKNERWLQMDENIQTFKLVAEEWMESNVAHWSATYARQVKRSLDLDVFPKIGTMPIKSVTSAHLLKIIKEVEGRGANSIAVLIRQWSGQIYRYAIATLRADSDPSSALYGAIKRKPVRHNPPLPKEDISAFLLNLEKYGGFVTTKIAIKLMMLTFLRTVELRNAQWSEFDFGSKEWRVPADRMKMKRQMLPGECHIVPLSRQAIELLEELKQYTGGRPHLFPNVRRPRECMTSTTINAALDSMGYGGRFSGHGFRSTASTLLHEMGWRSAIIERQLAHAERNKVAAAYNHAEYLPERREMMQAWADWIDLQDKAKRPDDATESAD